MIGGQLLRGSSSFVDRVAWERGLALKAKQNSSGGASASSRITKGSKVATVKRLRNYNSLESILLLIDPRRRGTSQFDRNIMGLFYEAEILYTCIGPDES